MVRKMFIFHALRCVTSGLYSYTGVRILLEPTAAQYLREANPGDPAESANVCITAEANPGLFLERSVTVTFELSSSSNAGMPETDHSWSMVCSHVMLCCT